MLTFQQCKNAQAKEKPYKLVDGGGLYLYVRPNGKKHWHFRYRFHGKENQLSFGAFPEVTILEAHDRAMAARKLLRDGVDPPYIKRQQKLTAIQNTQNTFEKAALAWHKHNEARWSKGHAQNIIHRLRKEIFPLIGDMPLSDITPRVIPAERMKMRREHIVPLADQAIAILEQLKEINPYNSKEGCKFDWISYVSKFCVVLGGRSFACGQQIGGLIKTLPLND